MKQNTHQLFITMDAAEAAAEEVADLTRNLRRELLNLDIEDADFAQGVDLPEGAKSAGAIDWNTLILTLIGSGGLISSLIMVLNSWVQRNPQIRLHLTLPNCGELKIEGSLTPNSELYQQALEIMRLCLDQQAADAPLVNDDPALVTLYQKMNDGLDLSDVRTIYFGLSLDFEQFGGESLGKNGKIQLLIMHCKRHGRLAALKEQCLALNPAVAW